MSATTVEVTELLYSSVESQAMVNYRSLLVPILAELVTLGPGNEQHPSVILLKDWLLDPERTVDDFNYVVGSLGRQVDEIMTRDFKKYTWEHYTGSSSGLKEFFYH